MLNDITLRLRGTTFSSLFAGQVDVSRVAYRPRESPYPMISVSEAVETVLEHATLLSEETVTFTGLFCTSYLAFLHLFNHG